MPTPNVIRVAIVGLGAIFKEMAPALLSNPGIEIIGLVDKDTDALNLATKVMPNAKPFDTLSGCLKGLDFDAVIVNTPAISHFDDVELALANGRHCLVAKPLTPHLSDAEKLIDFSEIVGKTLCVAEQIRYNSHFEKVRELVSADVIGQIESVILLNSKPRPKVGSLRTSRNVTLEEMSTHHFDILLSFIDGSGEVKVYCEEFNPSWSRYSGGGMVNALLTFANKTHVTYQGGVCAQAPMYELRLEGFNGALRCRGSHMSYGDMGYEISKPEGVFEKMDIQATPDDSDPWNKFLNSWTSFINGGEEPPFSGRHNLRVLQLIEAARKSAEHGTSIVVPSIGESRSL